MNLLFVLPSEEHSNIVWEYRKDFIFRNENIDGSAGLQNAINFNEWLNKNKQNRSEETVEQNLVPATTYLVFDKDFSEHILIGMIDIRHSLNTYLLKFGGNIGYSVKYEFRNKGYGKAMLEKALSKCKEYKMSKILLTCDKNNIASQKVIEYNNGVLENVIKDNGKEIKRYWIDILTCCGS